MSEVSIDQYRALQRRNTDLNEKLEKLARSREEIQERANRFEAGYRHYMSLQKACQNNPHMAEDLSTFLVACRLANEEEIPGVTHSTEEQYEMRGIADDE